MIPQPIILADEEFKGRSSYTSAKFQKIDVLKKFIRDDPSSRQRAQPFSIADRSRSAGVSKVTTSHVIKNAEPKMIMVNNRDYEDIRSQLHETRLKNA